MTTLYITLSKAFGGPSAVPLAVGSGARTEVVTISGDVLADITVGISEDVVSLYSDADCWVSIGASPDVNGTNIRFLAATVEKEFTVSAGERFQVKEA